MRPFASTRCLLVIAQLHEQLEALPDWDRETARLIRLSQGHHWTGYDRVPAVRA